MFARVAAVGYTEAKVEVEILEEPSLEVMPLDHTEAVDGSVPHCKLNAAVGQRDSSDPFLSGEE